MTANTIRPGDKPQPAKDDLPVVAWLTEDDRIAIDRTKREVMHESASASYNIALVTKDAALAYAAKGRDRALEYRAALVRLENAARFVALADNSDNNAEAVELRNALAATAELLNRALQSGIKEKA
jgi:hypothetical protein